MPDSGAVQDTGAPQDSSGPSSSVPINAPGALEDPAPKLAGQMSSLPIENVASRTAPNTVMSPAEQPAASASASAPSRPSTIAATEIAASEIAATETKPRPAPETDPLAPRYRSSATPQKRSRLQHESATDAGRRPFRIRSQGRSERSLKSGRRLLFECGCRLGGQLLFESGPGHSGQLLYESGLELGC